jgi:anthranilate phosphoribosyltransferase
VHGDGTDELALTGASDVRAVKGQELSTFTVIPEAVGLRRCEPAALVGGDREENAHILVSILDGTERGAKLDMVLLNSAAALVIAGIAPNLSSGVELARGEIEGGAALAKLRALQAFR